MKLKVCGLNNTENIVEIADLQPNYMGFIFYPKSKRYVVNHISAKDLSKIPNNIKKVGVFVNEDISVVEMIFNQYKLDYVQLHGDEDQSYCAKLFLKQIPIIKAFNIDLMFDFKKLNAFMPFCSYFLFDAKGKLKGGNGIKFNWDIIRNYDLKVPFFLSGGIEPDDVDLISDLKNEMLYCIDINSKFELEPGIKDIEKVEKFKNEIKKEKMRK